jgi:hypothetical protein
MSKGNKFETPKPKKTTSRSKKTGVQHKAKVQHQEQIKDSSSSFDAAPILHKCSNCQIRTTRTGPFFCFPDWCDACDDSLYSTRPPGNEINVI